MEYVTFEEFINFNTTINIYYAQIALLLLLYNTFAIFEIDIAIVCDHAQLQNTI
jgi:hypothetical protein